MRTLLRTLLAFALQIGLGLMIAALAGAVVITTGLDAQAPAIKIPVVAALLGALYFGFYQSIRIIPIRSMLAPPAMALLWNIPEFIPALYFLTGGFGAVAPDKLVLLAGFLAGTVLLTWGVIWLADYHIRRKTLPKKPRTPDRPLKFAN